MIDQTRPKYRIGEDSFSIQYMSRTGFNSMPRPHEHPYYELYYLLNGERVYFMNGNVYTVKKGDMIIINPHTLHSTASSDKPGFERILINFAQAFIQDGDSHIVKLLPFEQSRLLRIPLKDQSEIEHLLKLMLAECKDEPPHYIAYVRSLMNELLIRIHRVGISVRESPKYEHPMHHKVSEIAQYINNHYDQKITLEQVANQFYISPSYLSRIFTKLTGFHFREYLQVVRIREAQQRLVNRRESVQFIAEQVGFEHIAHFNKTFKKLAGTTPLRYRKQHKG